MDVFQLYQYTHTNIWIPNPAYFSSTRSINFLKEKMLNVNSLDTKGYKHITKWDLMKGEGENWV